MADIGNFSAKNGRILREDGTLVNEGDIMSSSWLEIARGNRPGASLLSSYGRLETSGAASNNIVWPVAGTLQAPVPPSPGVQMTIESSSINDTYGGSGVNQVTIVYLDGNLDETYETINLDGQTPVTTVADDIRFIQCMYASLIGSGGSAAGDITAKSGSPDVTYSIIPTGKRRCASGMRRVPRGKRLIIAAMAASSVSVTADTTTEISLAASVLHIHDATEDGILFPLMEIGTQNNGESMSGVVMPFPEGSVVGFVASSNKAAIITATFAGWTENAS